MHPVAVSNKGHHSKPLSLHPQREMAQAYTLKQPGVVLSWISDGSCANDFVASLVGLLDYDRAYENYLRMPNGVTRQINIVGGPRIANTRTQVVHHFLGSEGFRDADWLLMIDDDMTFPADALSKLMRVAKDRQAQLIGGLCFAGNGMKCWPTLYETRRDTPEGGIDIDWITEWEPDTVVECAATGAAFMLVHRELLMRMALAYSKMPNGADNAYPWFVEGHVMNDGHPIGEDVAFCIRANHLGHRVLVDTSVKIGHIKSIELTEALWQASRVPHLAG